MSSPKSKFKIAVASGKGGVGKSMLASTLAMLFAKNYKVAAVDCDVDAPNLHLWLGQKEKWDKVEKISTNLRPVINKNKCNLCGKCKDICAFDALSINNLKLIINNYFCEGCAACEVVCPQKAIKMKKVFNAEVRIKQYYDLNHSTKISFPLISAQLFPGETGSGKIVEQIKSEAEKFEYEIMILDAPAGIGCPVIAALKDINFVILITEPTPSGFQDLKRVLTIVNYFNLSYGVVINKWDINPLESDKIDKWALRQAFGPSIRPELMPRGSG